MDPVWKAKWIEALRSGKYKQAQHKLRDSASGGFCCLGVLCDIVDPSKWVYQKSDNHPSHDDYYWVDSTHKVWSSLPYSLTTTVGLYETDPVVNGERITELNDNKNLNFSQIADLIEEYL